MHHLQVQQQDIETGKNKILFSIETTDKKFMTNELHLMYDEVATETKAIKVVEINAS